MISGPHILLINGNTTPAVTVGIEQAGRAAAPPGVTVSAITPPSGPATVESYLDGQLAAVGVCAAIAAQQEAADAFVIACFSDPGLYAAREFSRRPVVGIAEAAMLTAVQLGGRFGLLTPQPRLRPVLEGLVRSYGFADRLAGVQVVDWSVAAAAQPGPARSEAFLQAGRRAWRDDGAEVLILAGAVLAGLEVELAAQLPIPVLDPIKCAVAQAYALLLLGQPTNRADRRAVPERKACRGCPPELTAHLYRAED
jgi:Asp/Glu/hydantoin racemase